MFLKFFLQMHQILSLYDYQIFMRFVACFVLYQPQRTYGKYNI